LDGESSAAWWNGKENGEIDLNKTNDNINASRRILEQANRWDDGPVAYY
jgi:hypothetical protein